jgi:hypothetical protein
MAFFPPSRTLLNGSEAGPAELARLAHAFADTRRLTAQGGLLFRAAVVDGALLLGVLPAFADGTKRYHYEIPLPAEPRFPLLGTVTPDGAFSLLFRPRARVLNAAERAGYGDVCVLVARCMLASGYRGPGRLDSATRLLFAETSLFAPEVETLHALAGQACTTDAIDVT